MSDSAAGFDDALRQRIREILAHGQNAEPAADLLETGDADSLSVITIATSVGKDLWVSFPESQWNTLAGLEQVFALVQRSVPGEQPAV